MIFAIHAEFDRCNLWMGGITGELLIIAKIDVESQSCELAQDALPWVHYEEPIPAHRTSCDHRRPPTAAGWHKGGLG